MKRLLKEAEEHEPTFRVRVVAAVVNKGKIVAIGKNQNKTHPVAARFCKHPEAIYLHAEVDAINKAKKFLRDFKKAELHVVRIRVDGTLGSSKPCEGCEKLIKSKNISKVFYTKDNE